jgi:hypothetical protein
MWLFRLLDIDSHGSRVMKHQTKETFTIFCSLFCDAVSATDTITSSVGWQLNAELERIRLGSGVIEKLCDAACACLGWETTAVLSEVEPATVQLQVYMAAVNRSRETKTQTTTTITSHHIIIIIIIINNILKPNGHYIYVYIYCQL